MLPSTGQSRKTVRVVSRLKDDPELIVASLFQITTGEMLVHLELTQAPCEQLLQLISAPISQQLLRATGNIALGLCPNGRL